MRENMCMMPRFTEPKTVGREMSAAAVRVAAIIASESGLVPLAGCVPLWKNEMLNIFQGCSDHWVYCLLVDNGDSRSRDFCIVPFVTPVLSRR